MAGRFLSCRAHCRAAGLLGTVRIAAYGSGAAETAVRTTTTTYLGRRHARSHATAATAITAAVAPAAAPTETEQRDMVMAALGMQVPERDAAAAAAPAQEQQQQQEELKKQRYKLLRAVKKHMEHMNDPWTIAQHVEQTLLKDRFDEALLLTEQCSKDRQVVVAWNHLIGYQLERQQLRPAIKLFNEASAEAKSSGPA
ncbi:hypothetical protein E4U41_001765 [Claviceps citrina]|nr:hypothetical protein E4U41_001765 [Claviceps citrina]